MKNVALVLDEITITNRIYTKSMMEECCMPVLKEQIKNGNMFVCSESPVNPDFNLNNNVAIVNDAYIDSNKLIVDFEFLRDNPLAHAVQEELNRGNIRLKICGRGNCQWNGEKHEKSASFVNDFQLTCFYFYDDP